MPDQINASGLTVKTAAEITTTLQNGFRAIYGSDINLDQNSPDGQIIGIFTQASVDIRELAVQVNNGFDPDEAVGVILDQRVVFNNIERVGGTFTSQPVDITVNATTTLQGLDANFNDVNATAYTVQDNSGNQFLLVDTVTITAGLHSLSFRAQKVGNVNVPVNTITNPVTIVGGVTAINNSSAALQVGQNEETDAELRVRRQRSVALSSSGYLNGLLGTILKLTGVTDAKLYENVTDATDANGIPEHGIWAIVENGANSDIADAIYKKKSYGANMKGAVTVNIPTASGGVFVAQFDRPTPENLYMRFSIQTTVAGFTFDQAAIKAYMASNILYSIGDYSSTLEVTDAAKEGIAAQGGGGVPVLAQISTDGVIWTDYLTTATLASKWTLDVSRIAITIIP